MGWGALMGLGSGLQSLGNTVSANAKDKAIQKLEADRLAHSEQRADAKAERERLQKLQEVQSTRNIQDSNGQWVRQSVNLEGTVLKEEPLDAATVTALGQEQEKAKFGLDHLRHQAAQDKLEEKYGEQGILADIAYKKAQAGREQSYSNLNDARADNVGVVKPTNYKPAAPPKASAPSRESLQAAFGVKDDAGKMVIDEKKYADFRRWKAQQQEVNPEYRSGEYSLDQYLAGKNARADVSIDGGPTVKVAPQAVDTAGQLYTLIKDRRAEGKPDLSRDELIGLAEQGLKTEIGRAHV